MVKHDAECRRADRYLLTYFTQTHGLSIHFTMSDFHCDCFWANHIHNQSLQKESWSQSHYLGFGATGANGTEQALLFSAPPSAWHTVPTLRSPAAFSQTLASFTFQIKVPPDKNLPSADLQITNRDILPRCTLIAYIFPNGIVWCLVKKTGQQLSLDVWSRMF